MYMSMNDAAASPNVACLEGGLDAPPKPKGHAHVHADARGMDMSMSDAATSATPRAEKAGSKPRLT